MRDPFWLSRAEVRELDRRAIHDFGVPSIVLMENAGRGAAELFARLNPNAEPVLILCGRGNNGGDGFVVARHLERLGIATEMILFADLPDQLSPDCRVNYEIALKAGLPIHPVTKAAECLIAGEWVIDALFGSGLDRPLGEPFQKVIELVAEIGNPVFAIDLPSGLDCDTGEPLGPTMRANYTATFVGWKKGFLNRNSRTWTGEIHVVDIGAPKILVDEYRHLPSAE